MTSNFVGLIARTPSVCGAFIDSIFAASEATTIALREGGYKPTCSGVAPENAVPPGIVDESWRGRHLRRSGLRLLAGARPRNTCARSETIPKPPSAAAPALQSAFATLEGVKRYIERGTVTRCEVMVREVVLQVHGIVEREGEGPSRSEA
jgi:hypothetical protein